MTQVGIKTLAGLLACALAWCVAAAQNTDTQFSGQLATPAELLRDHGIEITRPSLIAALQNSDPEIRSLAASELASQHDASAISYINDALSAEKDPEARISIAGALWSLHDPNGLAHLQGMCTDESLDINVIADVVGVLSSISESSAPCAGRILSFLDSHSDPESRPKVLSMLPYIYRWVPRDQATRIASELQEMLGDNDPTVRMVASDGIALIGLHSAADTLREAISREEDPTIQSHLQRSLDRLEKKK